MLSVNPLRPCKNFFASQLGTLAFALILFFFSLASPIASAHEEHGATFSAPGATIYYEVFGSGAGTPLFVANGGPGFDHNYLHVSDAWDTLGQSRKIVMWDQRGTGRSGALKQGQSCTLADQINDLDALRAHLGFDKIDLLGHSWGGFLAMAYAARHAEHIERLIILDSVPPRWRDIHQLFRDVFPDVVAKMDTYASAANLKGKGSDAAAEASLHFYFTMLFYSADHRDEFLAKMGNDTENRNVNQLVIDDLQHFDLSPEIAKFHFPVLVSVGRFDLDSPPLTAYKIHKAIPGSEFFVFEKSGHTPFFEEPEKFVQMLNEFLSSAASTSGTQ
ncbi:MAG TPA: alpha/beta fold hydrolase [Candidatus Acidoferrales bacterium]|nr:alpha/beta fold hydrolase [Candidatus Acidoferrales bacterium]